MKSIIKWIEKNLDLCSRGLGLLIGLFIVFSGSNQQIIALIAFVVAIVGIDPIREYVSIAIDKFKYSKKGSNPSIGVYDITDTIKSQAELPKSLENRTKINKQEEFHNLVAAAMQYFNTNQFDHAARYIEKALAINLDDINIRNWLSIIYGEKLNNKDKAIFHCNEILTLESRNISAMFNLAIYTNHSKGSDLSLPIYLEVEKLIKELKIPEDSEINAKLNLFIGNDYRFKEKKDISEARARYEKAISLFQQRIKGGDKTGVSEFWLKDAQKNLSELES